MKCKLFSIFAIAVLLLLSGCCCHLPDGGPDGNSRNGGEGSSFETAIVIEAANTDEGISKEYQYLEANACKDKGGISEYGMQELQEHEGHWFDIIYVSCSNGEEEIYYFQIDSFFGTW